MTDQTPEPGVSSRQAEVDRMIAAMTPPSATVTEVLTLLVTGRGDEAVPVVAADEALAPELRERIVEVLVSDAAPAEMAEAIGDLYRSRGPELNPDVIECYRAAFYLGRDWETYAHNPLYARFTANKAWQPFDKWIHYFDVYRRVLAPYVGKPVRVLEIGVFHGGGLDQLRYLLGPDAELLGIDIGEESQAVCAGRFEVMIGDQTDRDFLARLVAEHGPFDVIIDDGGHSMRQQITAVEALFESLNEGGVYIVEDTHTSYWPPYHDADQTFMEWVKHRVDDLNAYHHSREADLPIWTTSVSGIHLFDSMVVLDKKRHLPPFCEVAGTGSFVAADRISESMLLAYRGALAGAEARTEQFRVDREAVDADRQRVIADRDGRIEAALAERDAAQARAAEAMTALDEAARQLEQMSTSASWRVTEPLRKMRGKKAGADDAG